MATSRLCSIPDCGKVHLAHGLCKAHYLRQYKTGDVNASVPIKAVAVVAKRGEPIAFLEYATRAKTKGCLIWPFSRFKNGYGQVSINGNPEYAHRVVCSAAHGPSPSPLHEAAHKCGNGSGGCINPGHLRWATKSRNEQDKLDHGTSNRGERCGAAKLTASDVVTIRSLLGAESRETIARRFGVSRAAIRAIAVGRTWFWL